MYIIRGSAEGYMRGIAISAARIDALKPNVAIIQFRLRVWIVPIDSNVASSNMAASQNPRIQPRRLGGGKFAAKRKRSIRTQATLPLASAQRFGRGFTALRSSLSVPL